MHSTTVNIIIPTSLVQLIVRKPIKLKQGQTTGWLYKSTGHIGLFCSTRSQRLTWQGVLITANPCSGTAISNPSPSEDIVSQVFSPFSNGWVGRSSLTLEHCLTAKLSKHLKQKTLDNFLSHKTRTHFHINSLNHPPPQHSWKQVILSHHKISRCFHQVLIKGLQIPGRTL